MDLSAFLADPAGLAVKAALVAAFLDFAFGVFAALRDETFQLQLVGAFIRKHLLGRVFPVSVLAVMAYITHDAAMTTAAAGALTVYAGETLASIYDSIKTIRPGTPNPENPVPTD